MKRESDFKVRITRKIEKIPKVHWDAVYPPILEGYNFFKTIDESGFEDLHTYYISVYRKDEPVGMAPCFLMDYYLDTTIEGPLKKPFLKIREFFPRAFALRTLICGSVTCEGRIGVAGPDKAAVVAAIAEGMRKVARRTRASLLAFKDFSLDYTESLDALVKDGFSKVLSYPSVEIPINFKSFDEHLKTLSRSTKKDLKRKFRRAAALKAKIEMEVRDDLGDLLDEAYSLYLQTYSRGRVQFEKIPREFLKNISRNMKNEVKYFLWRIDNRLVAFNFCLVSKEVLIDEYIGLDYSVAYKHHLYFVTFRDLLDWCAKNGIRKYESGALTYEPKKRLGCRFIPHFIYVKHANALLNPLFKILFAFLKPENFDEVIKKMKGKGIL